MCVGVSLCLHVCMHMVLFSAIAGNIPQKTVTQTEEVGEGNCGAAESFFPEHRVLMLMNHSQSFTRMTPLCRKKKSPKKLQREISGAV